MHLKKNNINNENEENKKNDIINKKDFFFVNFLKNDFFKNKKIENYNRYLKLKQYRVSFFKRDKEDLTFFEYLEKMRDKFDERQEIVFAAYKRSYDFYSGFDIWNFLTNEEELLWKRMNDLWPAVVKFFTDDKYDYLFNNVNEDTKEDNDMFLYNASEMNDYFLFFDEDEEDEFTGLFAQDDDNPEFVEIYDDDMYMITFVWSFFFYCFLLCFDFSEFFFFPFLPIIFFHYYMYEPDAFEEEDSDPEQILLDNMYKNNAEFVEYQYQYFIKYNLDYKMYDYLYYVNVNKFQKNNFFKTYLLKKKILKYRTKP